MANTSFRVALWADALFAMDEKWWQEYRKEVEASFQGLRLSICSNSRSLGVTQVMQKKQAMTTYGNSGAGAIALAFLWGASKVIMLGYDCQRTGGKTHWHGDHPKTLGNAKSMPRWGEQFKTLRRELKGEIVNCTRQTSLTMFQRKALEDVLCPT